MEIIRIEDMSEWTPFAETTSDMLFNPARRYVQDMRIAPYISDAALAVILGFNRESESDKNLELYQFWFDYVRPHAVHSIFLYMAETHGYNHAPNGFVKFTDNNNTSEAINFEERTDLVRTYERKRNEYLSRMKGEFGDKKGVFDNFFYALDGSKYCNKQPQAAGITAIGSVNNSALQRGRKFRL